MTVALSTHVRPARERRAARTPMHLAGNGILILACIYFLFPLAWMIMATAKEPGVLYTSSGFGWSGHFALFSNIAKTFSYENGAYARWFVNSLVYSVGAAGVGCVVAAMAGFALAKYDFPGKRVIFALVLSGVLVPATALVIPLYLEFSHVHLVNTYLAVFLPSIFNPFGVYICRIFATRAIPGALLDAGRMDGANEWRIFRSVGFPLMRPVLVTAFSFQVVAVWNNFLLPLVMDSSSKYYPVILGLFEWNQTSQRGGAPTFIFSVVLAGSVVAFVPLAVGFLFLQRALRRGLGAGAVK